MNTLESWYGILIHHSAVIDDMILSDFEAIKRYHMSWHTTEGNIITEDEGKAMIAAGKKNVITPSRDIDYHRVTELVNGKYITREGRPLWMMGAHEPKVNKKYIGWCFVGNFDIATPSQELYEEGAKSIAELMKMCKNIKLDNVEPHNKYSTKTCPGNFFDMDLLKEKIKNYLEV